MAAFTLSPVNSPYTIHSDFSNHFYCFQSSQLCKNGVFSPTKEITTAVSARSAYETGTKLTCQAAAIERRKLMKLLLFGTVGLPASTILAPYSPPLRSGIVAKDEDGNSIVASEWLQVHEPGDKTLTQGLKGDPTYLMVENNMSLATYGINAVCTHLGCIVPWNTVANKFMCPCHGSQYNNEGTVTKGPAHLSLALADVDVEGDKVVFEPWTKTDFRTGETPWWS